MKLRSQFNKNNIRMKYFLSFIFLLSFSFGISAQKIHRQYSFRPQEEGSLYFIHPQKGFESKDPEAKKNFIYDITYLSDTDSASFTFTYFTKNVLQADSVKLLDAQGHIIYSIPARMFYVQPRKNYWQQRASIAIPYDLLVSLYKEESPYIILLTGQKNIQYTMKASTWKKQSGIVSRIFDVVKYNY